MEDASAAVAGAPRPSLHLSSLPAFSPVTLPKHLRQPSLPAPSGPLPRPPSVLENEEIGARLSASSPPATGSVRSKLTAFPFPSIPEIGVSPAADPIYNNNENDLIRDKLSPLTSASSKSQSSGQLSPLNFVTSGDSPGSLGRQPSAHTQASSDALGENSRPSVQYESTIPPHIDRYNQASNRLSTNDSIYSSSSIPSSQSNVLHNSLMISSARRRETLDLLIPEHQTGALLQKIATSSSDLGEEHRSTSRLSRLSYISSGAAFIVSEDGTSRRSSGQSYVVENLLPSIGDLPGLNNMHADPVKGPEHMHSRQGSNLTGTLGHLKDPSVRVHPADDRFEHTYRMRRASEAEDPIYVPVYSFEPPGKFPDRTRVTAPRVAPRFINHTPRNFSLPGREFGDGTIPRSSSDSAEMLLGHSTKSNGAGGTIPKPAATYDPQNRRRSSFGITLKKLSPISGLDLSKKRSNTLPIDPTSRVKPKKETARQKFEREHSHYFHDLSHLEKGNWSNTPTTGAPELQIHGPRHSFSKYGVPGLNRPDDSYIGDNIDPHRWPEQCKRQKRIGRSLLCACLLMPPMWLIMAVGLLDNLVVELTNGEIWCVGRTEKTIAAWLGGMFCFSLIVTIITVGVVVL
ncbi:hypothetical protein TWF694_009784 [Orbilia ellipsospora]|uniref:Uncharacterized protein n=1 Tax=Orbilia ellipsospora TaxID=2528407 RepID=A0AAV9XBW3_9PEZI